MTNYEKKINERLSAEFGEVMCAAEALLMGALDEYRDDMMSVFLRDKTLAVALSVTIGPDRAGRVEVEVGTSYVKERVKDKRRVFVTPGQGQLPGVVAKQANPEREEGSDDPEEDEDLGAVNHPFRGTHGVWCDVENRLKRVEQMDAEQLRRVIALPGCQKSVIQAAERRLRKLEKGAA